ncbi:hypothetical protein Tco_0002356 [Tanacetum coccineum]
MLHPVALLWFLRTSRSLVFSRAHSAEEITMRSWPSPCKKAYSRFSGSSFSSNFGGSAAEGLDLPLKWFDLFLSWVERNYMDIFRVALFFHFDPFFIVVHRFHPFFLDEFCSMIGAVQINVMGVSGFHQLSYVESDGFFSNSQAQLSLVKINYVTGSGEERPP